MKLIKTNLIYFLLLMALGLSSIPVYSQSNAHIVAYDYELSGDGILCSGETADLSLTITNIGTEPTTESILVVLSSSSQWLTIINDSAVYNGVAPGQFLTLQNGFTIHAGTSINNGQTFPVTITATCGDEVWESEIIITVYKPMVEFHSVTWSGNYAAGGNLSILVSFENVGNIMTTNSIIALSTSTSYITINNSEVNIGNLSAEGIGSVAFDVNIGLNAPSKIEFSTVFTSNEGLSITEEFSISNGCNVIFDLHDSFGDGWNNAELQVSFSNGIPTQTMTIEYGSQKIFPIEIVTDVTITVTFIPGWYDSECSFEIYYQDGDMIYQSSGTPPEGVNTTFTTNCSAAPIDCDSVSNLSVELVGSDVALNWTASPSGVYQIRRDGFLIATENTTHFTDHNVPTGTYYYCVTSVCNDTYSDPLCESITIYAPCSEPENVQTYIPNDSTISVSWSVVNGAQKYKVYRNNEYVGTTIRAFYNDFNLDFGHYCYNIVSVCAIDESDMSDESCIDFVTIKEIRNEIKIYPNPVQSLLTIEGENMKMVSLYNIYGQVLETNLISSNIMQMNLQPYDAGFYFLKIATSSGDEITKKIIVSK